MNNIPEYATKDFEFSNFSEALCAAGTAVGKERQMDG